jgi:TPR repeat protein
MGVDWMLMSLWELAESLGGPGTLEHYSWFIDPMPSPGIDFVVDKEAKDPLAQFPGLQWNPPAHADDEDKDTQPISTEATAQAGVTPQHPPKGESHESVPIVYENPSPRTNKKPVGQHMQGIAVDAVIRKFTAAYNRKGFHQYSGSSLAQYDAGLSNMRSGNMRDAIQLIKQSADAGYTPAYIYLARYHYERHEDQLTTRYLLSAIESGNAWGLACLAILMAEGRGVKKSIDDACAILQVGYNVSDAYCANNLGVLFFKHSATPGFDSKDVVTFFSKAVEWGCEAAARNLWNLGSRLNWPDWIDVTEINKLVNRFPAQLKSKNGDSQDIVFVWPSIER